MAGLYKIEDVKSRIGPLRPTPSFVRSPGPGGEGDSFGLQGGGSSLERAGFSRGFSAALRSRLPLRKDTGCPRENPLPPGFLIHRSPRRAILARENWGWASRPSQDPKISQLGKQWFMLEFIDRRNR